MKKPLLFAALSRRVAGITEQAQLYFDTIRRTPVVVTPAGESLPLENRSAKGSAGGYPSLDGSGYVPTAQLGSGAAGAGSKFLADDYTWKAGGGGGVTAHPDLTSLGWSASGHTGTASRLAGFDGGGAASFWTGHDVVDQVLTTRGDMTYRNGTGSTRLPIGAANRLLLSDGTDPAWAAPADVRTALDLATYYQPLDSDLTALAALASTGLLARTGAATYALRTLTAPAAGITVSNGDGVSGNPTLALADDLAALEGMSTTGLAVRTGASTWTTATVSAPLTLTGSTLAVSAASTTAAGVVELATDGETASGVVVQGNDSRLGSPGGSAVALAIWAGTGAGGNFTLDGSTAPSWGSWSTIGGVRTLTVTAAVTLEYDTLTFDFTSYSVLAVVMKGAKIHVRTIGATGTGTGYIDWNGGAASGATAGAGAASVATASPFGGGQNGATGRSTAGNGASAGGYNSGVCLGGLGGAGGAAGGSAGGAIGSFTRDYTPGVSTYGSLVDMVLYSTAKNWATAASQNQYQLSGGGGGSAGGCQITATSGGGGGGGGVVGICIGKLDMGANTLYVRANGGNGGTGVATSGAGTAGGGSGGGGGAVLVAIGNAVSALVLSADGGTGGGGATLDADVGAGGDGGRGGLVACIYGTGTAPTGTANGGTGGTGSGGVVASSGAAGTVYIASAVF